METKSLVKSRSSQASRRRSEAAVKLAAKKASLEAEARILREKRSLERKEALLKITRN